MTTVFNYQGKKFYSMVFTGTFTLWGIGSYMSFSPDWNRYYMLFMLAGLMIPAITATSLIFLHSDSGLKQEFTQRLFSLKLIHPVKLLLSLLILPLSVIISIIISLAFDGTIQQFQVSENFSFDSGFIPVLGLLFLAALFEELGWRGYGFESLEKGRSFLSASILFGILWSLWHLPLVWVNHSYQYEIYHLTPWYAVNFFVGTAILGIIISWVCHINRRSILVAIVFHFVVNLSQEMLSMSQQSKVIQSFVLAVFAIIIIVDNRSLFFNQGYQYHKV